MKFNRVIFNRIILGLIALLQTVHLICQIKKDYFIGTGNLSQLQIKQQIDLEKPIDDIIKSTTTDMLDGISEPLKNIKKQVRAGPGRLVSKTVAPNKRRGAKK